MAGLKAAYTGELALDMVILGDNHAVVDPPQRVEGGLRHLPGGLADRNQQGASPPGPIVPQGTLHGSVRQHRSQGGAYDRVCIPAEGQVHDRASRGLFTTLMGSPST